MKRRRPRLQLDTERHGSKERKVRRRRKDFPHGNYTSYYLNRQQEEGGRDPRLAHLDETWFDGKRVLDVGCNTGLITRHVARTYDPAHVCGIDLDPGLIEEARSSLTAEDEEVVAYRCCDVVPSSSPAANPFDADDACFDTILCLSVTKWIHLNHGDAGLQRFFRELARLLRTGGRLILEPQPWRSYRKKRYVTATSAANFDAATMRPEGFAQWLQATGMFDVEQTLWPKHSSRGFARPLIVLVRC